MESGFLELRKRPGFDIKMNSRDVDFEAERYMALAEHGDGFISHVENFLFL